MERLLGLPGTALPYNDGGTAPNLTAISHHTRKYQEARKLGNRNTALKSLHFEGIIGVWRTFATLFPSFKLVNDIHPQITAPDLLVYMSGIFSVRHPGRQSMSEKKHKDYRLLKTVGYYYILKSL